MAYSMTHYQVMLNYYHPSKPTLNTLQSPQAFASAVLSIWNDIYCPFLLLLCEAFCCKENNARPPLLSISS